MEFSLGNLKFPLKRHVYVINDNQGWIEFRFKTIDLRKGNMKFIFKPKEVASVL